MPENSVLKTHQDVHSNMRVLMKSV